MQQLKKSQKLTGGGDYNILLVVGAHKGFYDRTIQKVRQNVVQFGLPEEKLLSDWIVCIPGFTLEKYHLLKRSRISIFSINCFGNLISHLMELPFLSPFGNVGFSSENFIRFLGAPRDYMKETPTFREKKVYANGKKHIFVNLGDIYISAFHYESFEEFMEMWERRKSRINWDNLLVEMFLNKEDRHTLEQFDALAYDKKICFVPFKSDLPSACYISPEVMKNRAVKNPALTELREFVNRSLIEVELCHDPFDMLLYGKKTPLIEM